MSIKATSFNSAVQSTCPRTAELRIVVVSNAQPRFIWRLIERLRNEVPGVRVCGVVYVREETNSRPSVSAIIEAILARVLDSFLDWMHACPSRRNRNSQFTEENLANHGSEASWQMTSVCQLRSGLEFIKIRRPDLCVVIGDAAETESIGEFSRLGTVFLPIQSDYSNILRNPKKGTREISLDIQFTADSLITPISDLSAKIPIEPYDTVTSLMLKTNLIAADLAIEAVARIANRKIAQESDGRHPLPHISYWYRRTYPNTDVKPFASSARPIWRLCFIQALLFPYILVRSWYRRFRGRFPVTILVHHLISDVPHRLGMPTDILYREINFLKKHYRIVSLSEAVRILKSGVVKEPTIVLTFDDGYQENFITLRAVLEATGVPISMFVCSQLVTDQSHFLHDDQPGMHSDFVSLNWDQVAYWHREGMEIGSHTRSHFDCGSSVSTTLDQEIAGSKKEIEEQLNTSVRFFAFPFGKPENICSQAIAIATSCYDYFLSAYSHDNFPHRDFKQRQLMRKALPNNCWELELTLQSALDLREKVKRAFNRRLGQLTEIQMFAGGDVDQQASAL